MDIDKKEWLKQIGAGEFPDPIKYIYTFPCYKGTFNLSEKWIEDTSLEDLKAQYEKNKEYAMEIIEAEKLRDNIR